MNNRSTKFSWPVRLIVCYLFSIIILLGLLETVVRIATQKIEPTTTSHDLVLDSVYGSSAGLRPLSQGLSGGKMFSVDALGFWKYAAESDTLQDAWLLLGDSVTMGIGVEPDSTFAGRLSILWPKWRVLNPSWLGYSSADYANLTKALLFRRSVSSSASRSIRRVTLFWTLNDVYSHHSVGLPPGQVVRDYGSSLLNWVREHYRTYSWLKLTFLDRPKAYFQFDAQFYKRSDPHFVAASQDLKNIKELCANAKVQFQVVLLPYEFQLRRLDSIAGLPQAMLSQELDSLHICWYDLASRLRALPGNHKDLYLHGDGIHFSNRGHAEISRYVQEVICSQPR